MTEAHTQKANLFPIYEVTADYDSGEWLGEPKLTADTSTFNDWCKRADTEAEHFDTYEHFEKDGMGRESVDSETRLIRMVWS